MPLTSKGEKIMGAMQREYGEKKGEKVFYASRNAGTIGAVDTITTLEQESRTREAYATTQAYKDFQPVIDTGLSGMDAISKGIPIGRAKRG